MRDELDILEEKIRNIKRRIENLRRENGWNYKSTQEKVTVNLETKAKVDNNARANEMDALKAKLMGAKSE